MIALASASHALAQQTWTVDDSPGSNPDFSDVRAALVAASAGDVILVAPGVYPSPVIVSSGVTLVGANGVILTPPVPPGEHLQVRGVPAGEVAVVAGFDRADWSIEDCDGVVVLSALAARGLDGATPAGNVPGSGAIRRSQDVRVRGFEVRDIEASNVELLQAWGSSTQPRLALTAASRLHLVGVDLRGPQGAPPQCMFCPAGDGWPAVDSHTSAVLVRASRLRGGDGGLGSTPAEDGDGGPAIEACGGSVRISDSVVEGGVGGGIPAPPISAACGAQVVATAPFVEPSLQLGGMPLPGAHVTLRVRANQGDNLRLLMGARPAAQATPGSIVDLLIAVDRTSALGVAPTVGFVDVAFEIPAHWRPGDVLYLQAAAVAPSGLGQLSNSLAIVLGYPDPLFGPPAGIGHVSCPGIANSTGAGAALVASGSTLVAHNDLTLRATSLPPLATTFFMASRTPGLVHSPGSSVGDLCLGGVIARLVGPGQVLSSGTTGAVELRIDLTQIPNPLGPPFAVAAGDTWYFQGWYRDSVGGAVVSNFTTGIRVGFE